MNPSTNEYAYLAGQTEFRGRKMPARSIGDGAAAGLRAGGIAEAARAQLSDRFFASWPPFALRKN
jgi:hypothetical protein